MNTQNHNKALTSDVIDNEGEEKETPEVSGGVDENRAVSIKHYLLPALLEEKRANTWSIKAIMATVSVLIMLTAIITLYIYGASLV